MNINKFKVWCKNNNEWEKNEIFISTYGNLFQYGRCGGLIQISNNTHDILWYTGLTDRNEKEIYQGDICLVSLKYFDIENEKAKVVFKDGGFQFQYGCTLDYTKWYKAWDMVTIEVIGNIYDNSELLINFS